uniref:15-cis-phytoene synthase n=1 Tax=Euglena gracilis TaxID=3039 RepID=A0A0U5ARE7_EUGGR|nr:phytoene synthase [Euglena gracilis]
MSGQRHRLASRQPLYCGGADRPRDPPGHAGKVSKVLATTALLLVCATSSAAFHRMAASSWFARVQPASNVVPTSATWTPRLPTGLRAIHVDNMESPGLPSVALETKTFNAQAVEEAYNEVEKIMAHYAKTFYLGSKFFPLKKRKAIWAVYVWCRRTDEIVDGPTVSKDPTKLLADLREWEQRLDLMFDGKAVDALDYALAESLKVFPGKKQPYYDMIEGMRMDLPVVGQQRYQTWDDLYLYCYRVASTVGLMTLPVMGLTPGYTFEQAEPPAVALGIALQITNILRDVGEDYRDRGRIYLPLEDMARFGVTEDQIQAEIVDENYRALMRFEIQRARDYYALAKTGIPMLAPEARMPVQSSLDLYSQILDSIERNDYDNFRQRAYVSNWNKLVTLPLSWLRTWGLKI